VPGVAVFLTNEHRRHSRTLARNLQHNGVVHEKTILLSVQTQRVPRVGRGVRCTVSEVGKGCGASVVKVGFMEQPQVPRLCATPNAAACRSGPTTPRSSLPR